MTAICCVIIQEATSSPLVSQATPEWLAECAAACATQLSRDVAPIYGGTYGVRVGSGPTDVQVGEMVFSILDSLPDAPGAIAYHDVAGGAVPVAFLALSTCSTLDDVSTAISHELCEIAGDPACDLWCDDGAGAEWARELCDAVESNAYTVGTIQVSDFLLPAFFAPSAAMPFNFMAIPGNAVVGSASGAAPTTAFQTAAGGYQIKRSSGTGETQVTGAVRALRQAKIDHWSSRISRRRVQTCRF
jgi:hypothetical protein